MAGWSWRRIIEPFIHPSSLEISTEAVYISIISRDLNRRHLGNVKVGVVQINNLAIASPAIIDFYPTPQESRYPVRLGWILLAILAEPAGSHNSTFYTL